MVISLTLSKIPPLKNPASVVVEDLAVEVSKRESKVKSIIYRVYIYKVTSS